MTKDEALKLALEALDMMVTPRSFQAQVRIKEIYDIIREALAQPEQNQFNPDWDAMAVMVEEQQRMAKRIAELEAQQEPVAWINWCAATGKRTVSFECESELASQPLYEGITQNTRYHYSKFHSWFDSELHRQKYTKDHPAYLAAQEAWNAANDAAQHRINRLNAEIEAWKVRFKIAEDALAKLNGPEQEPVAWMHTKIEGVAVPHRPADLDKHPDRWEALYKTPPPCPTCEALARTVMLDQTSHDTTPPQPEPVIDKSAAVRIATALGWEPKRKPLTDEEIQSIESACIEPVDGKGWGFINRTQFVRAIEAAHGIKE